MIKHSCSTMELEQFHKRRHCSEPAGTGSEHKDPEDPDDHGWTEVVKTRKSKPRSNSADSKTISCLKKMIHNSVNVDQHRRHIKTGAQIYLNFNEKFEKKHVFGSRQEFLGAYQSVQLGDQAAINRIGRQVDQLRISLNHQPVEVSTMLNPSDLAKLNSASVKFLNYKVYNGEAMATVRTKAKHRIINFSRVRSKDGSLKFDAISVDAYLDMSAKISKTGHLYVEHFDGITFGSPQPPEVSKRNTSGLATPNHQDPRRGPGLS